MTIQCYQLISIWMIRIHSEKEILCNIPDKEMSQWANKSLAWSQRSPTLCKGNPHLECDISGQPTITKQSQAIQLLPLGLFSWPLPAVCSTDTIHLLGTSFVVTDHGANRVRPPLEKWRLTMFLIPTILQM